MSLAALALALRGWSALVMLGVWGTRVAIAKATEATDLKTTKVWFTQLCYLHRCADVGALYIGLDKMRFSVLEDARRLRSRICRALLGPAPPAPARQVAVRHVIPPLTRSERAQ